MLLIVLTMISLTADACSSAGGRLITAPHFHFEFYPPVSWTYSDNINKTFLGQWSTPDEARKKIRDDVKATVVEAIKETGYEIILSPDKYTIEGGYYTDMTPFPIGNSPGDYVVELGAVTKQIIVLQTTKASTTTTTQPPAILLDTDNGRHKRAIDPNTPTVDNVQTFQIKIVNSGVALAIDQWSKVSDKAYAILSSRYKVRFVSNIKITEN